MSTVEEEKRICELLTGRMRLKLRKNCVKAHWLEQETYELWYRLKDEVYELDHALLGYKTNPSSSNFKNVLNECADVANFAAMIMDKIVTERRKQQNEKDRQNHRS